MTTETTYAIMMTRHYYGPRRETSPMTNGIGQIIRYASRAEARREIARIDATVYETRHNESGRPSCVVARIGGRRCPVNARGEWSPRA